MSTVWTPFKLGDLTGMRVCEVNTRKQLRYEPKTGTWYPVCHSCYC
jgi:hypothetical protein